MSRPIQSIAVLGNDEHAWSVAAALVIGLKGQEVSVSVCADEHSGQSEPELLSLNTNAHEFHHKLGIGESALLGKVSAGYSYGLGLRSEQDQDTACAFVYSSIGRMIERVHFHYYLARHRIQDQNLALRDYSIVHQAAEQGVFSHPQANSALSSLEYTLNVDRAAYVRTLRDAVLQAGVSFAPLSKEKLHRDQDGRVNLISLVNGAQRQVDFVIDCCGSIDNPSFVAMNDGPCFDRSVGVFEELSKPTPVLDALVLGDNWTIKTTASQGARYHRLNYSSRHCESVVAERTLREQLRHSDAEIYAHSEEKMGYLEAPWQGNVLSLGKTAVNLGDQLFSPLFYTQAAIQRWLSFYPRCEALPAQVKQFHRETNSEYKHVIDIHSLLIDRLDHSKTLKHRVSLFEETGRVAFYENDVLESQQWTNLLLAKGVWPKRSDPLINHLTSDELRKILRKESDSVSEIVRTFPKHDALLTAIRAAK